MTYHSNNPSGTRKTPDSAAQSGALACYLQSKTAPTQLHRDSAFYMTQTPGLGRSWDVNAESMAEPGTIERAYPEELDTIFRAHYQRVARTIGRIICDQARAEELAVEVFLKWWHTSRAHGEHAEGWLYRTAIRMALDELRRQTRRDRFERVLTFFHRRPPTPEQQCAAATEQEQVRTVLNALQRRHTEVLLLWSEDFSYQEIATALAVSPSYVGSLVSRAQNAFQKEYVKRYGIQS
jgi:RNA polymerase sigma-70 factor (ECF subfamily)